MQYVSGSAVAPPCCVITNSWVDLIDDFKSSADNYRGPGAGAAVASSTKIVPSSSLPGPREHHLCKERCLRLLPVIAFWLGNQ